MNTKVNGSTIEIALEGPISEKTALFELNIQNYKEIKLNMSKVTFINSIGVKNWILWTCRVPADAKLSLEECPFVIVNQVNIVHGFLPKNARVISFHAPFLCEDCSHEHVIKLSENVHYKYAGDQEGPSLHLPSENKCSRCSAVLEPDFIVEKTFGFIKK
ncbi:hypothetical protein ACES2I_14355 [Bdellovibrio bacteriovorus]|uniref:hypothetical protein n=1 Tax=Bdellovibrio bacteriovorus TaxID=959 RepID=UPI0035A72D8A